MRAARTDANHSEIKWALEDLGWSVFDTSPIGRGFPDLIAARRGEVEFVEVKDGRKKPSARKLTPAETRVHEWFALAGVRIHVVQSVDDVAKFR